MDGLLVDSEPLAATAMASFLASFDIEVDPVIQAKMLGRRLPEAIAIAREAYALPGALEELAEKYGSLRMDALRGAVKPMPGAREIVQFVRQKGIALALATSGMRSHADISLAETGLTGSFDIEVTGDDVTRGKPAPDLFLLSARRLDVAPASAVVLEDSPLGVEAAVNAGMRVVAVQNGRARMPHFPTPPTVSVSTLFEAQEWLDSQITTVQ